MIQSTDEIAVAVDNPVTLVGGGPAGARLGGLQFFLVDAMRLLERQRDIDRAFPDEILMPIGLRALVEAALRGSGAADRLAIQASPSGSGPKKPSTRRTRPSSSNSVTSKPGRTRALSRRISQA